MIYRFLVEFRNFQIISGLRKLEKLLAQGKWKEADQQTSEVMFTILGLDHNHRKDDNIENCKNFPPEPLKVIDNLWVKYSKGCFGFSVQKQIWKECKQILEKRAECGYDYATSAYGDPLITWLFGDRVGWRTDVCDEKRDWLPYKHIDFYLQKGKLPSFRCLLHLGNSVFDSDSTSVAAMMLCFHFFPSHPEIDQIPDLDNLQINYTKLKHSLVYMDQGKVIEAWKLNYVNLTIVILSGLVLLSLWGASWSWGLIVYATILFVIPKLCRSLIKFIYKT